MSKLLPVIATRPFQFKQKFCCNCKMNPAGVKLKGAGVWEGDSVTSPKLNFAGQKDVCRVKFEMRKKSIITKVYFVTVRHLLVFELMSYLIHYVISITHLKIIPVSLQSLLLRGPNCRATNCKKTA